MDSGQKKRDAQALALEQEATLSNIAELAGVGAWEVDLETDHLHWSDQSRRILELHQDFPQASEAGIGLFVPEARPQVQAAITQSLADHRAFDFEHPLVTGEGRSIWVRVVGRPLVVGGVPVRIVGALQDVTDQRLEREALRKALEAAELALSARTAYQEALDKYAIVAITDRRGDIVFVNDRFCEISGYDRDELMGKNHRVLNSGCHPRAFFIDLWKTISSGQSWHGEVCNRNKSGELYWVDTTIVPLMGADGRTEQYVSVRYDITERKTAESERLAILKMLNERSIAAEAATTAKSQFLATMSHELRTPMNGVIGMLDLLMKTELNAEQALRASTALGSARNLLVVLNDILDFSRLESGQVTIESIAISTADIIADAVGLLEARAEEKGVRLRSSLTPSFPAWVTGDPTRVRQVLLNLIGNAIKFTEAGQIEVRATYDAGSPGQELRFEVSDTGIGLSQDQQEQVFLRFVQADASTTRRFGGTGLGLAISKQLVELMGGAMGVRSALGSGSTFWFTLGAPVAEAPFANAVEPDDEPVCSRSLKILVADDHHVNRMLVQMYLEGAGHVVTLVDDGAQALAAVQTDSFDLVLMDIQMPVMDGVSATRLIRALPYPAGGVPIVALTANAMAGDRERYLAESMDDYVAKPIEVGALMRVVQIAAGQPSFAGSERRAFT